MVLSIGSLWVVKTRRHDGLTRTSDSAIRHAIASVPSAVRATADSRVFARPRD
jgi:hypothetical protein